ncbi:SDR family NAD(P)-dependent oxidoreductase [Pseudonocardia dioxanivorans]|jgi:NAD(P)-dependent dehydrogenase (short-subunit alcohol dehydrogenase family)|uniref:SDR family NAD(P)-dependent oxidoreductase n=1 Tax=Pseudonocardia dioxanivorans TaxID=240495 RepID=UPI000CD0EF4D|nr:SDR family oxidoreductase [Pseudonocardia dioxanivorans]
MSVEEAQVAKQVVVTGAGRGLGVALVEVLTERGWTVWATDVDPEALAGSAAAHRVAMDVADPAAVAEVMAAVDRAGGADAVVNNAGIYPLRSWDEHDGDLMHEVFDVNVVGALRVAQAGARSMIARGVPGSIVNVVSLAFHKGHATGIAYSASKGALIGTTRSLAKALGPHGIRVNAVAPGLMRTEGTLATAERGDLPSARLEGDDPERTLPGRTDAHRVAATIALLLGPDTAETTGQVLLADGGTTFL